LINPGGGFVMYLTSVVTTSLY